MTGRKRIKVESNNGKLVFDLELLRKITIIRGYSGTGKTTLVDLIRNSFFDNTAIKVDSDCQIEVLDKGITLKPDLIQRALTEIRDLDNIIFIADECFSLLADPAFADAVNKSMCYFILIIREDIQSIKYSHESIFEIDTLSTKSGTVNKLRPMFLTF